MERTTVARQAGQPGGRSYLFALNPCSRHHSRSREPDRAIGSNDTNQRLGQFVAWINDYCARHRRPDQVPDVQGRPFKLGTRQFRRTLAWFIARRPGGAIAGAIQYRHQHIQMFEGYAGSSASGFRAEVEAEEALARGQFLGEMGLEIEHVQLTGPAARDAEHRLAEFARHATFDGQVITDQARLQRVLAHYDPHVYTGTFVTCAYNADRALCRRGEQTPDGPHLNDCRPLLCRNVALTAANRDALAQHLTQLEHALATGHSMPPYQQHRLQQQRDEITEFLARHTADQVEAS